LLSGGHLKLPAGCTMGEFDAPDPEQPPAGFGLGAGRRHHPVISRQ
jgi:hypothetical protein